MSKCRYDLSEDCNNTDCLTCVLGKIRAEIIEKFGESECAEECGCLYELLEVIDKYKAESEKV